MQDDTNQGRKSRRFPTTASSLVQAAKERDRSQYLQAMNRFITGYWKPVFYFIRAKGYAEQQAEDLTQEFFLRLLQRDWIQRANLKLGRFRTFILKLVTRFLSDQGPKRAPRQQRFEQQLVSVARLNRNEERAYEPATPETPEDIFMKQWAAALIKNVRHQLEERCAREGHSVWYEIFAAKHFPASDAKRVTQQVLADNLGMSRDQVRHALEQASKWFAELLQAEVRDQMGSEAELGEEIRELMRLLGK